MVNIRTITMLLSNAMSAFVGCILLALLFKEIQIFYAGLYVAITFIVMALLSIPFIRKVEEDKEKKKSIIDTRKGDKNG